MTNEPVRLIALLTAATGATINVLALLLGWGPELIAGLGIGVSAWIAVGGEVVRLLVTPKGKVKLTKAQYDALVAAGWTPGKRKLNPEGDLDGR